MSGAKRTADAGHGGRLVATNMMLLQCTRAQLWNAVRKHRAGVYKSSCSSLLFYNFNTLVASHFFTFGSLHSRSLSYGHPFEIAHCNTLR